MLRIFSHYSRWLNAMYRPMLDTYSFEQELIFITSQLLWQKTFGFEIPSQRPSLFPSLEIFLIRILVISWHGTSIHNGHLWLPVTLWTVAEFAGAVTVRFNDFFKVFHDQGQPLISRMHSELSTNSALAAREMEKEKIDRGKERGRESIDYLNC